MANSNKKYFWLKMPKDFFEDRFVKKFKKASRWRYNANCLYQDVIKCT